MNTVSLFLLRLFDIKEFGLNAATIGVLGANTFTFFQGWSAWHQNKRIWRDGGESVSIVMFSYLACYFMTFFVYAVHHHDATMTINAVQGFLFIPIVVGLWKKQGFTRNQKLFLLLFSLEIPIMYWLPSQEKEFFFFVVLGALTASFVSQPMTLLQTRRRGNLDIRLPFVYAFTGAFWAMYGYAVDNWVLYTLIGVLIWTTTIILYYKFK